MMTSLADLRDILRVSLQQAWRRRRRYIGVVVSIALGTAGFVVIVTTGHDFKAKLNLDLDLLGGATLVKVTYESPGNTRLPWFRTNTCEALRRLPGVRSVSLAAVKYAASSTSGNRQHQFTLVAVDEFFWDVNSFLPVKGSLFGVEAMEKRHQVCVLGVELSRRVFGTAEPVGRCVILDRDLYRVVGVLDGLNVGDRAHFAFIPLSTARNRIAGLSPPNRLYVRCRSWDTVQETAEAIPAVVRSFQSPEGLQVEVPWEQLKRVLRAARWIELFIHVAVAATLMLGGFGIWNGMMASVRSRTREIGLKKAMGAEDCDILVQFLGEALFLSVGAALLGVLVGGVLVQITGILFGSPHPPGLFFISGSMGLLLSILLGVGSGLYPSIRASRMEVVSALRYES